jgi:hypothetical protein
VCQPYGMTDDNACGIRGQTCLDCTLSSRACINGYCQ